ncbi:hypothetical protein [Sulfurirhabdus autotrophica]|uniref:Uncharacterized protein n=1 Tax=Sulfurirhabdus autotrophica TaxID=1706046 RepID=A0A4R3XUI3_9PROT|nr:hypothetical protein [Sulfurirhabdus autotrophica]TCV79006.1 hypothetical protein EDC63_1389 [Sulfurirhabdus autotrophica]
MNLHALTDLELEQLARPIYMRIIRGSNAGNYSLFSDEFTNELLERITSDRFASQRNEFPLLSSISVKFEYLGCIRRELDVSVLWRLRSAVLKGEFLGSITLRAIGNEARVSGVAAH